jgi:uncharacterized membrane protein (DUF106 family)
MFKPHIISALVAIFFMTSAYFFLTAYNRYMLDQEKLKVLTRQVRLLKQRQREMDRKKRILTEVDKFINRARSLGLERDRWAYYNVILRHNRY